MCGIAGIYLKRQTLKDTNFPVERMVDSLFCQIASRGRHATGYVAASADGKVQLQKDAIPAEYFVQLRDWLPDDSKMVLCHTRFATQGSVDQAENNHPVVYGSTFVTHNGVVYNDDFVFKTEELPRNAEVDSIVFPALLTKYGWESAEEELKKVQGSYAIAAINPLDAPNELILARGESSPLYYVVTRQAIVWASEYAHLYDAWKESYGTPPKRIRCLQEGQIMRVKDDSYEIKRYMEEPNYSTTYAYDWTGGSYSTHRQREWWDYADEGNTVRRSTRGSAAANLDCTECGKELGTKRVVWEHENENTVTEYSVYICQDCWAETDGEWDRLRFGHCGPDDVKEVSYLKNKRQEPKSVGSVMADDPNVDRFLTLVPGQVIPEDLRYCFNDVECESCGKNEAYGLDDGGMPECKKCFLGTNDVDDDPTDPSLWMRQCSVCNLMTSTWKVCADGVLCPHCQTEATDEYEVCEYCRQPGSIHNFTYRGTKAMCNRCRDEEPSDPKLIGPDTPESDLVGMVERLYRIYNTNPLGYVDVELAVKRVAAEAGFKNGVLSWLLNDSKNLRISNYLLDDLRVMYGLRVLEAETAVAAENTQ